MTCARCGAPLDPTVTHVHHDGDCDGEWCNCDEVCAACCTDPDCPLQKLQHGHQRVMSERDRLKQERQRLRQALWDCYAAMGFDTDGDATPDAIADLEAFVVEQP